MWRLTLDVLGRTIFSDGLGREPKEFVTALSRYFETIGRLDIADLFDFPDWVPRINRIKSQPALDFFAEVVEALISRRRALLAENPTGAPPDLLTLLLQAQDPQTGVGLSEVEVQANIVTFIGAGHETTANALTWSLYLLANAPEWQERLAAEADAALAAPSLRVDALVETRAVIEEAMRLYPPVASMSRVALGADDLAGRRIRKGALVLVAPWVLHRHRRLWEDPELFDPRRFLPGKRETIDRFAYLPFGAGPRVCIGAAFALQEAMIALAKMMQAFHVQPVRGTVEPVQRITLRPRGGMPLILRRRTA
jgi:cytochrome P450